MPLQEACLGAKRQTQVEQEVVSYIAGLDELASVLDNLEARLDDILTPPIPQKVAEQPKSDQALVNLADRLHLQNNRLTFSIHKLNSIMSRLEV